MRRRDLLLLILAAPWPPLRAIAGSPEDAKRKDKPKPPPPPPNPGKPRGGDKRAPLDDMHRAPDGDPLPPWRR